MCNCEWWEKKIVDSCESYGSPITLTHVINKLWQIVCRKRTAPWDRADYLNVKDTNGIHSWTSQVQSLRKVVWMMFAMLDLWELLASHLVWNFWICHWRNKFSLIKFANNAHTTHIVVKPRWTVSRWRDWIRGYWSKLVG